MKKQLYLLCLLFAILALPLMVYAEETSPTILLNALTYKAENTPLLIEDTLYLSGKDLAAMTYGNFTQTDTLATLTIQEHLFCFDLTTEESTHNHMKYLPEPRIRVIDQTVYFQLTVLTDSQYPYTYENHQLIINALLPYSTATDRAEEHQQLPSQYDSLNTLLTPLLDDEACHTLITEAKKERTYLSLISIDHKKESIAIMKNFYTPLTKYTVHLRHVDMTSNQPILTQFETYPISYRFDEDVLTVSFDNHKLSSNCFWATYYPYNITTDIDVNKSLDVMIMRLLYEHYRDTHELKDDLSVSPILKVNTGRSDSITYDVYFPNDTTHHTYQLILYKQCSQNAVNYYVDLIKKND